MSKQVAWTKFIYETFCEEAMLNETERFIIDDPDATPHKVAKYFSM